MFVWYVHYKSNVYTEVYTFSVVITTVQSSLTSSNLLKLIIHLDYVVLLWLLQQFKLIKINYTY